MESSGPFLEIGRPALKTLSLHKEAFPRLIGQENWRPCIPTVEHITLLGHANWMMGSYDHIPWLYDCLEKWLGSVLHLTSLRLLRGFNEVVLKIDLAVSRSNWNSVLLEHKDTLEELVFDGYRGLWLYHFSRLEADLSNITRFGPTRMLSCLPELKKLAYLKVPLHFLLSQVDLNAINENTPPESLPSPNTAQEALALIETSFPSSLKRLDIVVYGFYLDQALVGEIYPLRTITVRF